MKKQIMIISIILGMAVLLNSCSKKTEQVLFQEAQKALEENKFESAVKNFEQIIRYYPGSQNASTAYYNMGMVYLIHLNDQDKAENTWNRLRQKYPQFDLEKEFFGYAQKLQDEGKPELAIKLYDEILKLFPESKNKEKAFFLKGFVYSEELEDYNKAGEIYKKFIEEYPQSELKDDAEYLLENMGKEPVLEK
ncbi:MAG: tetratricopeptide repeat protein [candidate division Zixibacteria bacterium]|nr:tetratricopeptide repeat protein [candidate division Zixibacteria bacterium]